MGTGQMNQNLGPSPMGQNIGPNPMGQNLGPNSMGQNLGPSPLGPGMGPSPAPASNTSWAAAAGKGLPPSEPSQAHGATNKQLEQLNSVREALFSQVCLPVFNFVKHTFFCQPRFMEAAAPTKLVTWKLISKDSVQLLTAFSLSLSSFLSLTFL